MSPHVIARSTPRRVRSTINGLALAVLLVLTLAGVLARSALSAGAQDATPAADLAANKALVVRYFEEMWNQGNLAVADEILTPDYTWRFGMTEIFKVGPEAVKLHVENLRRSIDGLHFTVDILLAEGEYVAARWSMEGNGPGAGGTPVPQLLCTGNNIYRVEAGKLAEVWQETVSCV
jgi:hypothetical protein